MGVKSKLPTNSMIFLKIVGYVDERLMISFLAVYEFYHTHKNIGMLLQKIATNTFSAVGCFLHFSSFRQNSTVTGKQDWARYYSWVGHAPYAPSWLHGWPMVNTFLVKIAQFLSLLYVSTSLWWHHVSTGC